MGRFGCGCIPLKETSYLHPKPLCLRAAPPSTSLWACLAREDLFGMGFTLCCRDQNLFLFCQVRQICSFGVSKCVCIFCLFACLFLGCEVTAYLCPLKGLFCDVDTWTLTVTRVPMWCSVQIGNVPCCSRSAWSSYITTGIKFQLLCLPYALHSTLWHCFCKCGNLSSPAEPLCEYSVFYQAKGGSKQSGWNHRPVRIIN